MQSHTNLYHNKLNLTGSYIGKNRMINASNGVMYSRLSLATTTKKGIINTTDAASSHIRINSRSEKKSYNYNKSQLAKGIFKDAKTG